MNLELCHKKSRGWGWVREGNRREEWDTRVPESLL